MYERITRKQKKYNKEEKFALCSSVEKKPEVPLWKKTTLTIEEAAEYSNIGQNKLTELLKNHVAVLFSTWEKRNWSSTKNLRNLSLKTLKYKILIEQSANVVYNIFAFSILYALGALCQQKGVTNGKGFKR